MILFYNAKTINLSYPDPNYPDVKSCAWSEDYSCLGISVCSWSVNARPTECCLFDESKKLTLHHRQYFESFVRDSTQVIGYHSRGFSDPLMQANGVNIKSSFDLLEEVRLSAFGSRLWSDQPHGYCYSLEALASINLPYRSLKTSAPYAVLWQRGEHQEVIDSCILETRIIRDLYYLFIQGSLRDPNNGKLLIPSF